MIKKIYFFGTSHTAGGGFEFESKIKQNPGDEISKNLDKTRGEYIKEIYSELFPDEEQTQENYSFVGQFKKLLIEKKIDVEVINISKQGYGNERIYRKFYDIVNEKNFKIKDSLFVFEFSDIERKEIWNNDLNGYTILNYSITKRDMNNTIHQIFDTPNLNNISIAKTYWYENENDKKILDDDYHFYKKIVDKTINGNEVVNLLYNNLLGFLSFLEINSFNFLIAEFPNLIKDKKSRYMDFIKNKRILFDEYENMIEFINKNKLLIFSETEEKYTDLHASFTGNKLIAKYIFNSCIDNNFIIGDKCIISKNDFKFPKKTKTFLI